jgi:hypothetical protein
VTQSRPLWKPIAVLVLCLLSLLATACDAPAGVLEPTRPATRPAESPVAALKDETALPTAGLKVGAKPTATLPLASQTPDQTPTRTLQPAPSHTPLQREPARIVSFTASPSPADPAGTLRLAWEVRGADSVTLSWVDKSTRSVSRPELPLSGSLVVPLADVKFSGGDEVWFSIHATDADNDVIHSENGEPLAETLRVLLWTDMEIISFTASPDPLERGGTITLTWNAPKAASVGITRLSPQGDIFLTTEALDLPSSGTIALMVPEWYVTSISYYLGARDARGVLRKAYARVSIICPYEEHMAPQCPLSRDYVPAANEPFQRGQMVWRGDTREIWVLYDNGWYETYQDTWSEGEPLDIQEAPPEGYFTPVRGFGKLWADLPWVRARLGWATAPEAGYDMLVEGVDGGSARPRGTSHYFSLPDGTVVHLHAFSQTWEVLP